MKRAESIDLLPVPDARFWRPVKYVDAPGTAGMMYFHRIRPLKVIVAVEEHGLDGRDGVWLHVSISHEARIPFYEELKMAKEEFMGDRRAVQIFPPKREFVNHHPNVLHLFSRLDADFLPDLGTWV